MHGNKIFLPVTTWPQEHFGLPTPISTHQTPLLVDLNTEEQKFEEKNTKFILRIMER